MIAAPCHVPVSTRPVRTTFAGAGEAAGRLDHHDQVLLHEPGGHLERMAIGVGDDHSLAEAPVDDAVAVAGECRDGTIVASTDSGLEAAALLGGNVPELRAWVADVLGGLARDDDNAGRLRDTLRVFLRCNASYEAADEELDLHYNSVKYRVGRAIALRGGAIDDDRLDVELALLTCHWYGRAVLATVTG